MLDGEDVIAPATPALDIPDIRELSPNCIAATPPPSCNKSPPPNTAVVAALVAQMLDELAPPPLRPQTSDESPAGALVNPALGPLPRSSYDQPAADALVTTTLGMLVAVIFPPPPPPAGAAPTSRPPLDSHPANPTPAPIGTDATAALGAVRGLFATPSADVHPIRHDSSDLLFGPACARNSSKTSLFTASPSISGSWSLTRQETPPTLQVLAREPLRPGLARRGPRSVDPHTSTDDALARRRLHSGVDALTTRACLPRAPPSGLIFHTSFSSDVNPGSLPRFPLETS